jgi:ligand-binding SRPBCC domain-containing protein
VPVFEASAEFACSPAALYDFLVQPANILLVTPPDLQAKLVEGPERVEMGSRITIEGRRLGMRQVLSVVVVALEPDRLLADEQVQGPFRKYRHERRLEQTATGTLLVERIEFEPPRGMLGLLLTAARIHEYFSDMYEYRIAAMRRILTPPAEG